MARFSVSIEQLRTFIEGGRQKQTRLGSPALAGASLYECSPIIVDFAQQLLHRRMVDV
jgi:hypothetical protein